MGHPNPGINGDLPESIAEDLQALDDEALRDVVSYAQQLLRERAPQPSHIEAAPGEEIISIEEQGGYTLVTKTQKCAEGCEDCPHGPYLYLVREEHSPVDHEPTLHWVFLGRVDQSNPE
jgi:hypothetical protein